MRKYCIAKRPSKHAKNAIIMIVRHENIPHCKNRLVEITYLNWLSKMHLFLTNFIGTKYPKYWLF